MVDLKKPMNLIYLLITCAYPYPQKKSLTRISAIVKPLPYIFLTKNWPPNTPAPLTFKRKGRQKLWRLGLYVRLETNEWVRLQSVAKSSLCISKGYIKVSVREKKIFCFTSKALFVLQKIKVQNFRYSSFKYILLNNFGSNQTLLTKFGQLMSYYKIKIYIKKFCKNCDLKTSSRPFVYTKN